MAAIILSRTDRASLFPAGAAFWAKRGGAASETARTAARIRALELLIGTSGSAVERSILIQTASIANGPDLGRLVSN
jgi:hypothetical protein